MTTSRGIVPAAELGRVHFIGIGGAGMSGIARVMLARGIAVSGSDARDSDTLRELEQMGAHVHVGHAAENLGQHIWNGVAFRHAAAQEHGQRHRRVVVAAGNRAAGINHHHEDSADCQRRNDSGPVQGSGRADRQDKKKVPMNSTRYLRYAFICFLHCCF